MLLCYLLSFTLPSRDQERKKQVTKEYRMFISHLLFEQNHKIPKVPREKHFSPLRDSTMLEKTLFSCSYLTNILLLLIPSIYISVTMKMCLCVCMYIHIYLYTLKRCVHLYTIYFYNILSQMIISYKSI